MAPINLSTNLNSVGVGNNAPTGKNVIVKKPAVLAAEAPYGFNPTKQQQQQLLGSAGMFQQGGWYGDKGQYWDGQFYPGGYKAPTGGGGGNNGGGGGGSNVPSGSTSVPSAPTAVSFGYPDMNLDEYYRQIDQQYQGGNDYLNQIEQTLRGQQPGNIGTLNAQAAAQQQLLDTQRNQGMAGIESNTIDLNNSRRNALAESARMFSDLRQGYQQRFGGVSSAGEAANTISDQAQQRQLGQTQLSYDQSSRQIQQTKTKLEEDYNNSVFQNNTNRDNAIQTANNEFQSKLMEIVKNRTDLESNKSAAKLNLLSELRTNINNINSQATQYQQQLNLMKEQASLNLDTYLKQLAGTKAVTNTNSTNGLNPEQVNTNNNQQFTGITSSYTPKRDTTPAWMKPNYGLY
jgi:hypothetical protein